MSYILYIPFGLLPSIIWLIFYLRKDSHPESKLMVLKIFFYGMLTAIIAALIEVAFDAGIDFLSETFSLNLFIPQYLSFFLYYLIAVALIEEVAKFLVVQKKVLSDPEFDEPVDTMIYMIISALGFAALENLLYLLPSIFPGASLALGQTAILSGFRFLGATFLHALASGLLGFFLALAIFYPKRRKMLLFLGIAAATLLHGLFNISIIGIAKGVDEQNNFLAISSTMFLFIILSFLAFFVSFGFKKLKKIASVCKI